MLLVKECLATYNMAKWLKSGKRYPSIAAEVNHIKLKSPDFEDVIFVLLVKHTYCLVVQDYILKKCVVIGSQLRDALEYNIA